MNTNKPVIFITGQKGLVGQALTTALSPQFHVHALERVNGQPNNPSWNYQQSLKLLGIKSPDVVIHLAGAGIADKRWTKKYKKTIYDSRINGTQWLVDEISIHEQQPHTFLCASAIGFYGNRPDEKLNESAVTGNNFVAKIAENWEKATAKLAQSNVRVANLRFSMILSTNGGALKEMLLPFKLGLGGRMGTGNQVYSWVAIDDVSAAIEYIINNKHLNGPINITSPNPITNAEYTKTLAKTLKRPAFMHLPSPMVRLVFGEVADELLLASAEVEPKKLLSADFKFKHPELRAYLKEVL